MNKRERILHGSQRAEEEGIKAKAREALDKTDSLFFKQMEGKEGEAYWVALKGFMARIWKWSVSPQDEIKVKSFFGVDGGGEGADYIYFTDFKLSKYRIDQWEFGLIFRVAGVGYSEDIRTILV